MFQTRDMKKILQRIAQSRLEFDVSELSREVCIARSSIFVGVGNLCKFTISVNQVIYLKAVKSH